MVNRNSFQEQFKREVKKSKRYRKSLLKTSKMLDKDGYPTNECLEIIKKWHFYDPEGWFKFIKKYWRHSSFGWNEEDGIEISEEDLRAVTEYIIETFSFDLLKGDVEVDYVDIDQSDLIGAVYYFFSARDLCNLLHSQEN